MGVCGSGKYDNEMQYKFNFTHPNDGKSFINNAFMSIL